MKKTNVIRLLDHHGIDYQIKTYEPDEDDLSAIHAAQEMGLDVSQVYKTLCVIPDGRERQYLLCSIPADSTLALKRLADIMGAKKCEMAPLHRLQPLTGYLRGGCSPLCAKGNPPFVLHQEGLHYDLIGVSAGVRGMQVLLRPQDLLRLTEGKVGWLTTHEGC